MKFGLLFMSILLSNSLLSGCTTKEIYNATQVKNEAHCNEKVGVEREDCIKELYDKPYEEYEKERQAIIKNEKTRD